MAPLPRLLAVLTAAGLTACGGHMGTAEASAGGISWESPLELASGEAWQGPWRMNESDFRYVDDPNVTAAADGTFAVAWVDQARKDVMLQVYAVDATPRFDDGPVSVSRSPDVFSWLPRVVLGNDEAVFVLWQEILFTGGSHGGEILFARSEDGGRTFSDPINLSETTAGAGKGRLTAESWHNGSLDLDRAADGTLYAAWTEYEGGLWVAHSTNDGAEFSAPVEVVATGSDAPARGPALTVTAEGVVLVTWTVGEDPAADIHLARSTDSGRSFSDPQRVHVSSGHADAPTLAVAGNGRIHLAWGYRDAEAPRLGRIGIAHSDDDGENFSSVRMLDQADDVPHGGAFPSLAADGDGVHVVAERVHDSGQGFQGMLHAWAADGETFTALRTVPGSDEEPSGGRQGLLMQKLALHPDGRILTVHSTYDRNRRSSVRLLAGRPQNDT
ncbi:MAG: exo-alpha-sialidase [Gammaproteobacteria bacterium]|nr:MAG: exo-alpha-sialidase [Gammaproteobacteria bacterium]